LIKNKQENS